MNFTKDELSKLSHAINWVITDAVEYVDDLERDISWQWFGIKNQQQEEKTLKSSEITELMDLGVHFDDVDEYRRNDDDLRWLLRLEEKIESMTIGEQVELNDRDNKFIKEVLHEQRNRV